MNGIEQCLHDVCFLAPKLSSLLFSKASRGSGVWLLLRGQPHPGTGHQEAPALCLNYSRALAPAVLGSRETLVGVASCRGPSCSFSGHVCSQPAARSVEQFADACPATLRLRELLGDRFSLLRLFVSKVRDERSAGVIYSYTAGFTNLLEVFCWYHLSAITALPCSVW